MSNKRFIPIIIILLLAIPILATAIEVTDVFTNLKDNQKTGTATFTLDNPELSNLQKSALTISFNEECGEIISYNILTLQTCYKPVPTYKTQRVCYTTRDNKTSLETETCRDQQIKTGEVNSQYPCYKPTPYIYSGMKDYKIDANIKMEQCEDGTYGYKIDWIPKININTIEYEQKEWAWWNTSYLYRRNINTSKLTSNQAFVINGSGCLKQNGSKQCIRTDYTGNMSIYYNDLNDILVSVDDTSKNPMYYETGNGTSWNQSKAFGLKTSELYDFELVGSGAVDKVNNTINWTTGSGIKDSMAKTGNQSIRILQGAGNMLINYGIAPEEAKTICWWQYLHSKGVTDGGTAVTYFTGGNNTRQMYIGFGKDDGVSIWYHDGAWKNSGIDMVNGTWEYYCLDNISYAGTYDLVKNGGNQTANLLTRALAGGDGIITTFMHTGYTAGSSIYFDEFTFYNQDLTSAEINETYQNYLNTEGYGNLKSEEDAPSVLFVNTTLMATNITAQNFNFSSSTYITGVNITFNTSAPDTNLTILSSMNIKRVSGGATSIISTNITIDGTQVLEENLRTIVGTDEGSTGTSPIEFNVTSGTHTLEMRFKRTGNGIIEVNDIDLTLIKMLSNESKKVWHKIIDADYQFTSTTITDAFNWTINKTTNSSSAIITKFGMTKTGAGSSTVTTAIYDITEPEYSPYAQRYLSSSSDLGSIGLCYIEDEDILDENHSIRNLHTDAGETITMNGTILYTDMKDVDNNTIQHFQNSNENTNYTETLNFTAGVNLIMNTTRTQVTGNGLLLGLSASFKSLSGANTPTIRLNITNVTTCNTKKERYLSDNSDIGNVFIYLTCQNLTIGETYKINAYLEVSAGETINLIDESMLGIETTSFNITPINLPPISNGIIFPENYSAYFPAIYNVTINPSSEPNGDNIYYNYTLYYQNGTLNGSLISNTTNVSININLSTAGNYTIIVTSYDDFGAYTEQNVSFYILGCNETWVSGLGACLINDSQLKTYTDSNTCGTTFNLPVDNGTYTACDYCIEDLTQVTTNCDVNGTQNVTYTDNNFVACCFLTNIVSDCSVLYTPPFNETTAQNCTSAGALINNFTCSLDTEPILHDKINIVCEMPDNQTYCCLTNTFQGTNLLATSPEYQDTSDGLLSLRSEEETRECFTPNQRLLNAYYTPKNVRTDTQFKMQVLCTSTNGTSIKSEYMIMPSYVKPDWIFNRMVWAKQNMWEIVGVMMLLILIAVFLGYLYKKSKTGI